MHVDLLSTTKGSPKIVHGTENGKRTACGINLLKPENVGMFTSSGTLTDVVQLTCEKCKTVIAKKMIREANKELAAQIKEEQKMMKRERAAAKHHHDAPAAQPAPAPAAQPVSRSSSPSPSSGGGYIPPSMRKAMQAPQQPIETPTPTPPPPVPMPAPTPVQSAPQDVLSQFAIPTVPSSLPQTAPPPPAPISAPTPVAQNAEDVLAQFAVPTVPTSRPQTAPPPPAPISAPTPVAQNADDVLAQFAIPTVPTSLPQTAPSAPAPMSVPSLEVPSIPDTAPVADSVEDVLAQFTVSSAPAAAPSAPAVSKTPLVSGSSVNQNDILAQFALKQPGAHPYPADDAIPDQADPLADLLLMPKGQEQNSSLEALDDIVNVPSGIPNVPTAPTAMQQAAIPSLNVPQAPPAPPVPAMPVPPVQQPFTAPVLQAAQPIPQAPQQQFNPFAVPSSPKKNQPATPTPLFVGYSADGRQLFQTYDTLGNPIPINEPVYSAPPEQKDHNIAAQVAAMASNAALHGNAPIMDMDEVLASMGIADPSKKKKDEGKAINYTEYKIPEKKKKKPAAARPASAVAAPVPEGPVSAAEAKRRKKVDKINKEFEKQLRSRGIDPKTGGLILDNRK